MDLVIAIHQEIAYQAHAEGPYVCIYHDVHPVA